MTRHDLPPTQLDDARTVWLYPDPDPKADPGWRLRLDRMRNDNAFLFEEQVLPERVNMPNAYRVIHCLTSLSLTRSDAVWLHYALGDMLAEWEDE